MIVRISTEGQYELDQDHVAELNALDNAAVHACEVSDQASFADVYGRLVAFVREHGRALADEDLSPSDLILPPPDVTLEEARREFSGEGLIPG